MILGIEDTLSHLLPAFCHEKKYSGYCENIILGVATSLIWAILAGVGLWLIRLVYKRLARKRRVFLSLPMAGLVTEEAFGHHRAFATDLTRELERAGQAKVYCGYTRVTSFKEWENNPATAIEILSRIKRCDDYVAILSDRVFSSVLCEIGFALARNKRVTVFYRLFEEAGKMVSTLPYLLVRLDSNAALPIRLNKYAFNTLDEILRDARADPEGFIDPDSRIRQEDKERV